MFIVNSSRSMMRDLVQFLGKEQLDVVHSPHFHLALPVSSVRELDIVREELKRRRTDDLLRVLLQQSSACTCTLFFVTG